MDCACCTSDGAKSPLHALNTGDVRLSTADFVNTIYCEALELHCKVVGASDDSTCSLTGSEDVGDSTVDSDWVTVGVHGEQMRVRCCFAWRDEEGLYGE